MAFVSGFQADIFISYKHSDNRSNWISDFDRRLQLRLTELLGQEASVWRDKKLGGADDFSDEIMQQLNGSALFIPILSPGYVLSEWCQKEFQAFQALADKKGGLRVGNKLRILKAVKTPMDNDEHRQFLGESLGFEFYERTPDSQDFREFHPETPAFQDRIDSLAQEICRILRAMRSHTKKEERAKATVYVAETSSDLRQQREKIVAELESQGYCVLPREELPDDDEDCEAAAREEMEQAKLSIHLLGPKYKTAVKLQYEAAKERNVGRVVWLSSDAQSAKDNQSRLLQAVMAETQSNLEFLENRSLEELKDIVLDKLRAKPAKDAASDAEDGLVRIYLVCDRGDHPLLQAEPNNARLLRDYLFDNEGFEVKLPATSQTSAPEVRKDNREKLMECDGVLLYWGNASEVWVDEKLRELTQAVGWRRSRFAAKAIYATAPSNSVKDGYRTREATLIQQFQPFSSTSLESFLAPLRKIRPGQAKEQNA